MHLGPQVMLLLVGHRQSALCERQGTDLMLSSVHFFLVCSVQSTFCEYTPHSSMYPEQTDWASKPEKIIHSVIHLTDIYWTTSTGWTLP